MVNVNPVDSSLISIGHGYYSSKPLLTDIYQILLGVKVEKKTFYTKIFLKRRLYFKKLEKGF
ncbi:Alpha/beta hydrolase, PF05990 domain protein [Leptospira interrogans serovar Canicola]|nr:Alpha/beta hydrolase, PF05990 domain protein [Leptospira interrogans serovar Canicola]